MNNSTSRKRYLLACLLAFAFPLSLAAKTDKTDLPFVDDPAVTGRWQSVAFVDTPEQFSPDAASADANLFFKGLEFLPGGKLADPKETWTKGVLLNPEYKTASKYTIKNIDGTDYMFLEWKTGDYILRDMDPAYYVLVRERDYSKIETAAKAAESAVEGKTIDCLTPVSRPGICRRPPPANFTRSPFTSLPGYVPDSGKMWQVDLRGQDISKLELSGRTTDLLYADFDSRTKFPERLPEGFSPEKIMELGKNPGLGVRALHKKGITGKGVAIGIIDQPLLISHKEYAASLRSYEELHMRQADSSAAMHGAAVASIAVGKTCGVAPDAELYYIGADFWSSARGLDFKHLAAAIDRLIAISGALPKEKRIRVISISRGFNKVDKGAGELLASIEKAKQQGVMVLTTSPQVYYDFDFMGLNREPGADPDSRSAYGPGLFWQKRFFMNSARGFENTLLVPMDSRTTASQTGDGDYVFYRNGGLSWAVPYIAGLYALACQADPGITPEAFFKRAFKTAGSETITKGGKEFTLEKVVDPGRLVGHK